MAAILPPRYAVVVKAHAWDDFVARQVARFQHNTRAGEVFLFVDETNRRFASIPFDRIVRGCAADAIALGLSERTEQGSLFWWNTDYPNYLFFKDHPDFDYYLFAEYDALIQCDIDNLIRKVAAERVDFVSLPTRCSMKDWMWTRYHLDTYRIDEIAGSLNCISIFSRRALAQFRDRRLTHSKASKLGLIAFWPNNEVFLASEARRTELKFRSLSEFGNTERYEWFPPYLETDIVGECQYTFVHPVLNETRYIASLLQYEDNLLGYHLPNSRLRRTLARFSREDYVPLLNKAFRDRLITLSMLRLRAARWRYFSWFRHAVRRRQLRRGRVDRQS